MFQDIRYGVRILTKNPAVTAVAVLTLALGIGANAAIFSGVSAFVMRELAVPDAHQLVRPVETADGGCRLHRVLHTGAPRYKSRSVGGATK